jgi:hypothetical protein
VIVPDERRHLTEGPRHGELPGGAGTVDVFAHGGPDAAVILDRCRAVLLTVLEYAEKEWPSLEQWSSLLPTWFLAACAPARSREETERWLAWWRTLQPADKARAEKEQPWALADWLYWLQPSERQWFWWDATATAEGTLRVTVEVASWPTALGSLHWLLRAAGAVEVLNEEI